MPQLDISIFFIDIFFGFFGFWILYVYNNKVVFPEIKRSLLLREAKILTFKLLFIDFFSFFKFWEEHLKNAINTVHTTGISDLEKSVNLFNIYFKHYGFILFLLLNRSTIKHNFYINNLFFCKTYLVK